MLVEKEIKKISSQLLLQHSAHVDVSGFDLLIRVVDHGSKLLISTQVYFGGNFIPNSVRKCLGEKLPISYQCCDQIKTYLTVDEEQFQIFLNYIGHVDLPKNESFKNVLEAFGCLADKWREHLDQNDKNDLIHVRVK